MDAHSTQSVLEPPLAPLHESEGAQLAVWFGCRLPDSFGNWREEHRFARETVALLDKNYRCYFRITGPDRVRYLNAILTNNIWDLALHHGSVGLLLSPQGRIQAEVETRAAEDHLLCVSYAMIREQLAATIEKFIIMDDVTLADESSQFSTLAFEGPRAIEAVRRLTGTSLESMAELESADVRLVLAEAHLDVPATLTRRSAAGTPAAEFLLRREHLRDAWIALRQIAQEFGGGPAGYQALNALRLEQGVPWFGYDFGDAQIPHEAGLQDTHISYTKGCYTGQEIVERVRSRGHANRVRVLLRIEGEPPAPGTALLAGGKPVGAVTRSAFSPVLGSAIAMAYVRREHSAIGELLEWSGGPASVIAPPLAAPSKKS